MSQINLTVRALVSSYTKLHWLCLLNDTDCYMCIKKITWIVRACAPDQSLTPLALVYVRNIHTLKSCIENVFFRYFPITLQLHNLPDDCTTELFKCLEDVTSVLDCNEENGKFLILFFFVGYVISGIGFRPFWLKLPGPGPQLLDGIFWLKFLLETRL